MSAAPLRPGVRASGRAGVPAVSWRELGWLAGQTVTLVHTDLSAFDHPGALTGGPWTLTATVDPSRQSALDTISLTWTPSGSWQIDNPQGTATGSAFSCTVDTLYSTPDNYLLSILGQP